MHECTSFVHSSQQREERTKKRRRGYRAFGSLLRSPSGSAELASLGQSSPIFPPSPLRLHRPIKAESGDLACILTPSPYGHSPYIPCRNTGEKGNTRFGNEVEFYCFVTPRHVTGHGRGRRLNTNDFLSPPKIVSDARDALRLFILLSSEKNEPRSAAAVIGLLARRYGRRRGLRNSLRSDSPRPFSSVFLATSPPDKGGIGGSCLYSNPFALRALPLYSL